jgi:aminoglycoside phosphotransferase (APT) family kinase protein
MSAPGETAGLPLLASGRDADVFALDGDRVLRRYRAGGDVAAEAAVMRYVAGHRFPAPAVYEADGPDMVLERVDGRTMLQALTDQEITPAAAAEVLADLHARLHALPPRVPDATDRVVHLDLHPDNVILGPGGPVLVDWRNATDGPPHLDVALTAVIIGEAAAGSHVPASMTPAAGEMLVDFVARVDADLLPYLERAGQMRRTDPNLTAEEVARVDEAVDLVRRSARLR